MNIAQVYYLSGNHEAWLGHYDEVKKDLLNENVKVLDNDSVEIQKCKDSTTLIGVKDPDFLTSNYIDCYGYKIIAIFIINFEILD